MISVHDSSPNARRSVSIFGAAPGWAAGFADWVCGKAGEIGVFAAGTEDCAACAAGGAISPVSATGDAGIICILSGKETGISTGVISDFSSGVVKCHTANAKTSTANSNAAPNQTRFCCCGECALGNGTSTESGINGIGGAFVCGRNASNGCASNCNILA